MTENIPIIDVSALVNGEDSPVMVAEVAASLRAASQNSGFIYIKNHGIAGSVINNARDSAHQFFALNEQSKTEIKVSQHHRGWLASGGARMSDGAAPDLKESYIWGGASDHLYSDHPLRGPNQYPAQLEAQFATSASAWYDSASLLARSLLRAFATSLDLEPSFFLTTSDKPLSRASYVYYPRRTAGGERFGVAPHTDFGVMTILCQDSVGGLEVKNSNGHWITAPPIEGTLIVNVGDLLARWTNNAFRSASHRVTSPTEQHRLSLVLAFDPDPASVIDPRDVFPDEKPANDPVTCGDYLSWRFARAFDYLSGQGNTPTNASDKSTVDKSILNKNILDKKI